MPRVLEQIFERHQLVTFAAVGIHVVVDGNVADTEHGEAFLDVQSSVKLVSAQTGQVFRDDDSDFAIFHIGHHLLEAGSLKTGPGVPVIHIKTWIRKVVVTRVPLKDHFLILNTV